MRYCPECGERFDEDIIKFCTKDGTPLVEEDEPKFTAMPSQSGEDADDIGEETVIRRKPFDAATLARCVWPFGVVCAQPVCTTSRTS